MVRLRSGRQKASNPIDEQIGGRIRTQRVMRGMSQTDLAMACGVSFQQIQKYERGANRVAGGRLVQIARALRVPTTNLIPGGDDFGETDSPTLSSERLLFAPGAVPLLMAFGRLPRPAQSALVQLMKELSHRLPPPHGA